MTDRILTLRTLNRATLARQMLLERANVSVPAAVERLVGMQAQQASAPFVGLWTRLPDFARNDLAKLIENRTIVKSTLMRATLHLVTANDYLWLRGAIQPALDKAFETISKRRDAGLDFDKIIVEVRDYVAEEPRTFAEISAMLTELKPDADVGAMRYAARLRLPLVQVSISSGWSYPGNPKFTLAESWLGKSISMEENLRMLIFRYLAAFGPATVRDIETWSGVGKLKDVVDKLKGDLVMYRDEKRRELLDLPELPLPDVDTPAPERFLPEFDNLLLSHAKRTRVLADEYRKKVYIPGNLRVAATILVDGFVRGTWKVEKKKGTATLLIEPFASLTKQNRKSLMEEGEQLVRFYEADTKAYEVRFVE